MADEKKEQNRPGQGDRTQNNPERSGQSGSPREQNNPERTGTGSDRSSQRTTETEPGRESRNRPEGDVEGTGGQTRR